MFVATPRSRNNALVRIPIDVPIPESGAPHRRHRILLYGDSNTAGFCANGQQYEPYGRSLSRSLLAAGAPCEVTLCGLSGLTGAEMAAKPDAAAIKDVAGNVGKGLRRLLDEEGHQDVVLIMVGTNDLGKGSIPEAIMPHVVILHELCHQRSIPTIALGPPTVLNGPFRLRRQQFVKLLQGWAQSVAGVLGFFDAEELVPRLASSGHWEVDELHFSATGSREFGRRLAPEILSIFTTASKSIARLAGTSTRGFQIGDTVEYFSPSNGTWIITKVLAALPDGAVQISAKAGIWISRLEQASKLRCLANASAKNEARRGTILMEQRALELAAHGASRPPPTERPNLLDVKFGYQPTEMRAVTPEVLPTGEALHEYREGQKVEYLSASNGGWVPCCVSAIDSDGSIQLNVKPGTWITKAEQQAKVRTPTDVAPVYEYNFKVGQDLEYLSTANGGWVPCKIIAVESGGAIRLDVKPKHPMSLEEQATKIRHPTVAAQHHAIQTGQLVEYLSSSLGKWILCHITDVDANGDVELDCKPGYKMSRAEQAKKIRVPLSVDNQTMADALGSRTLRRTSSF